MSRSTAVNCNCVLRRNVKTQPYGRCSVCTLELRGCHAWQAIASVGQIMGKSARRETPFPPSRRSVNET